MLTLLAGCGLNAKEHAFLDRLADEAVREEVFGTPVEVLLSGNTLTLFLEDGDEDFRVGNGQLRAVFADLSCEADACTSSGGGLTYDECDFYNARNIVTNDISAIARCGDRLAVDDDL